MDIHWKGVFMLSLKDIALRRVAINVCSGPAILFQIEKFQTKQIISDFERKSLESPDGEQPSNTLPSDKGIQNKKIAYNFENEWCRIVGDQIPGIMSELLAPVSIKKQIVPILKRIGLQMVHWKVFHEKYLNEEFGVPILSKLCWTYSGMVDYQKTAVAIIEGELLNDENLYKLACLYALVDDSRIYWEKMSIEIKKKYVSLEYTSDIEQPLLSYPRDETEKDCSLEVSWHPFSVNPSNGFEYSARRGNKAATEYFFRKLPPETVKSSIQRFISLLEFEDFPKVCQHPDEFPSENFSEVFLYVISRMSENMQRRILTTYPSCVLYFLLDVPFQDLYLENAEKIWACLSEESYDDLLTFLLYSSSNLDTEFYFSKFLRKLCDHSPADFKKHFVKYSDLFFNCVTLLLEYGDAEIIEVFLGEVDYAERLELLSSDEYLQHYCQCITFNQLESLKVCLEKAMVSREDLMKLFQKFAKFASNSEIYGSIYFARKFLQVLNEIFRSVRRKRQLEDENQTEPATPRKKTFIHIKSKRFEMGVEY